MRRYSPLTIWRELDRLQREMDRLFDEFSPTRLRTAPDFPAMNVWADEESVIVTAELPGLESKDIEVNVLNGTLTLRGERKPEELPEGARVHRQERGYGRFSRTLELPYKVDVDKVKAVFKNGVLQITLPRAEEDRPKKIAVKVA
ncbi:MAG: Hsp20/alpha crystallin family protein [Anaerolineae bacterium]|nr:MAG: Hsp20/alpha crystallin family protein [Anaerolineae bacterium]